MVAKCSIFIVLAWVLGLYSAVAEQLPNGGFEQKTLHWRPMFQREPGRGRTLPDSVTKHSGSSSLRLEYTGEKDWSLEPELRLTVHPGDIIESECWVRVEEGRAELAFSFWDEQNQNRAWSAGSAATMPGEGWQRLVARIVVPPGIRQVQPRILGSGRTRVWVDDVSVQTKGRIPSAVASSAPIIVTNTALSVTFYPSNGSFTVFDLRAGRRWDQDSSGADLVVTDARSTARGGDFRLLQVSSGLEVQASVTLIPGVAEIACELTANGPLRRPLGYPFPFQSRKGDHLVVPMNEGISYPVEDPEIEPTRLVTYGGHGICMGFYGVTDGSHSQMAIFETPDDAVLNIYRDRKGILCLAPEWIAQKGAWGYTRRLKLIFQPDGGHVAIAKRYRTYAQAQGKLVTLRKKAAQNPQVDKLIGAANIWCWERDSVEIARELQSHGLTRLLWSAGQPAEKVRELNALGVLTSRYDVYQDAMNPTNFARLRGRHADWTSEAWMQNHVVIDSSGDWEKGWEVEATDGSRIPCGVLCDSKALGYARQRLSLERPTHPYAGRFIDTTTASAWRECYHPEHPMTRTDSRNARMRLLGFFSHDLNLVTGSETGHDAAVPDVHFFEGMLSLGPYRVPDAGRRMQEIWTNVPPRVAQYQVGWRYRLPLWELVYHDSVVAHWYWGDYNNKLPAIWTLRDRFNLLYGTPPMFMFNRSFWEENKARFVQSYRETAALVRDLGYEEMTDHRFLKPDRSVQQTVFANGARVSVNFGDTSYSTSNGKVIPPKGYLIERE